MRNGGGGDDDDDSNGCDDDDDDVGTGGSCSGGGDDDDGVTVFNSSPVCRAVSLRVHVVTAVVCLLSGLILVVVGI